MFDVATDVEEVGTASFCVDHLGEEFVRHLPADAEYASLETIVREGYAQPKHPLRLHRVFMPIEVVSSRRHNLIDTTFETSNRPRARDLPNSRKKPQVVQQQVKAVVNASICGDRQVSGKLLSVGSTVDHLFRGRSLGLPCKTPR